MSTPARGHTARLPPRSREGHKGVFGTVVVIGGCCARGVRMIGAPALCALGALRSGAGLCRVLAPSPLIDHVLAMCPSATGTALEVDHEGDVIAHLAAPPLDDALGRADALAIGPGLGQSKATEAMLLRALQQAKAAVIVDADALHAMAQIPELWRDMRAPCVLTPHPGEFRALAHAWKIDHDPTQPMSRPLAAEALAQKLGCVVVLKGAGTVVSDGHRTWTCTHGHPCLGTAGTGDVLAGVLAGLLAQRAAGLREPMVPSPAPAREQHGPSVARARELATRGELPEGPDLLALAAARLGRPVPDDVRARSVSSADTARASAPRAWDAISIFDAVCIGVEAHARAGEAWANDTRAQAGMLASELAALLPAALEDLRESLTAKG